MRPIEWMKKTFDKYKDRRVRLVCIPLPPTPAHGIIYMPDAFLSKTYDHEFERSSEFRVVTTMPTKLGPAILAYVKLKDLVNYDGENGSLEVSNSTCCATVYHYPMMEAEAGKYVDEVQISSLSMMGRSCHPGSHFIVPRAPMLTALLQYAQAPSMEDEYNRGRTSLIDYMTPIEAEALFTACDFSVNTEIDEYIGRCTIDPKVLYYRVGSGLGEWSKPYLRVMRNNLLRMEDLDHEQWRNVGQNEVPDWQGQTDVLEIGGKPASEPVGSPEELQVQGDGSDNRTVPLDACGGQTSQEGTERGRQEDQGL